MNDVTGTHPEHTPRKAILIDCCQRMYDLDIVTCLTQWTNQKELTDDPELAARILERDAAAAADAPAVEPPKSKPKLGKAGKAAFPKTTHITSHQPPAVYAGVTLNPVEIRNSAAAITLGQLDYIDSTCGLPDYGS